MGFDGDGMDGSMVNVSGVNGAVAAAAAIAAMAPRTAVAAIAAGTTVGSPTAVAGSCRASRPHAPDKSPTVAAA